MEVLNLLSVLFLSLEGITSLTGQEIIETPFGEREVVSVRRLLDFAGNEFALAEFDKGYAIYDTYGFLEGSPEGLSPYAKFQHGSLRYLGFDQYLHSTDGRSYKSVCSGSTYSSDKLAGLKAESASNSDISIFEANYGGIMQNAMGDVDSTFLIENYFFFSRTTGNMIPNNYFGTCGFVSLAMYLTYLDVFYDGRFVDDDATYPMDVVEYNQSTGEYEIVGHQDHELIHNPYSILPSGISGRDYPIERWNSLPYATQALHDYLLYEVGHSLLGIGGYPGASTPMTALTIEDTFHEYMNANTLTETHSKSRTKVYVLSGGQMPNLAVQLLRSELPVIFVVGSYTLEGLEDPSIQSASSKWHCPLVYGFQSLVGGGLNWICHSGWRTEGLSSTCVLREYGIFESMFAVEYIGSHVHQYRTTCHTGPSYYSVCACGATQRHG